VFTVRVAILVLLVGLLVGCGGAPDISSQLSVNNAWIRELPPVSKITAVYMTIENSGHQSIQLVGAHCDIAGATEIHTMEHKDGFMKMRKLDQIIVPAGGKVDLEPGGTHLMLLNLKHAPKAGDEVEVILHFEKGVTKPVLAKVVKQAPDANHSDMNP
jgi:hypothetical protein